MHHKGVHSGNFGSKYLKVQMFEVATCETCLICVFLLERPWPQKKKHVKQKHSWFYCFESDDRVHVDVPRFSGKSLWGSTVTSLKCDS